MKRILSMLLAPMLLLGLATPALGSAEGAKANDPIQRVEQPAQESADARLKRITEKVKETLDLDTEDYDEFMGHNYEQELGTTWNLEWNGEDRYLSVSALDDGTVLSYWLNDGDSYSVYRGDTLPTLPHVDTEAAKRAAEEFLKRVLVPGMETVELKEPKNADRLGSESANFNGTILLNGIPSPLSYSVTVRSADNRVTGFNRDAAAMNFVGGVPSAVPAVDAAAALAALREAQKLELIYVPSENEPKKAVLRYVSRLDKPVYVDAQTGEAVVPEDEPFRAFNSAAQSTAEAADMGGGSLKRLTEAELTGIEKLQGVLPSAELDQRVRAEKAYMLDGFALVRTNYRIEKQEDGTENVVATLNYNASDGEDGTGRYFTVDARQGTVTGLWSYEPWEKEKESKLTQAQAQAAAEEFLARFTPHAAELKLYDTTDNTADGAASYGFSFARMANGYPFPAQSCDIQVNRFTGAITGVNDSYDETVEIDAAENLISAEAALDAWMGAFENTLAYRGMGKELDPAVAAEKRLIDLGMTRFYKLFLSYGLERDGWCAGIDARTGEPVTQTGAEAGAITYSDVAGHWAEAELLALAASGVGYDGGVFEPDKGLTQWDMVCLVASANGWRLDPAGATKEQRDGAYSNAYRMGVLARGERNDDASVDRMALVRGLLNAAGYSNAAALEGIYKVAYADAAEIAPADLGYAALAQGLGLVKGEMAPAAQATRAQAGAMLYRLMDR